MKRPAILICFWYAAGILAAEWIRLPFASLLVGAWILWLGAIGWSRARPFALPLLIFATGILNLRSHTDVFSENDLRKVLGAEPHLARLRGRLLESPILRESSDPEQAGEFHSQARIRIEAIQVDRADWRPAEGIVMLTAKGALTNIFAGQFIEADGVVAPPPLPPAPGLFNYRVFLKQQGIYYLLKCSADSELRILAGSRSSPWVDRFANWARMQINRGLMEDLNVRLEWALTLGWKTALTEKVSEPFIRAATYHIFAVDGLRMTILFGIFYTILRMFRVSRAHSGYILLPVIWFYVHLTGWPASAIRAAVMLSIVLVGWMLRRPDDLMNSLFTAALLILAWEPRQIFQAGFQLSFLVVLCIILMMKPLREWMDRTFQYEPLLPDELRPKWQRWLRLPARRLGELSTTSFAAWIGSIPLVAYYFNILTPVSTLANVPAVPLCGLVLISNLASLIVGPLWQAPAVLFNHAGWFFMELIRRLSEWSAGFPSAYFYVATPGLATIVVYYLVLFALLFKFGSDPRWRKAKIILVSLVVVGWGCWSFGRRPPFELCIMNPGGGTAIFSRTGPKGAGILIDCGNEKAAKKVTEPFLHAQGVNHLPNLVLTHGDLRQMGGAATIRDEFSVSRVWTSPVHFRSPAYRESIHDFARSGNLLQTISRGDRLGAWEVLHPAKEDHFPKADDNTLVLFGTLDQVGVLLLSDLGRNGQKALLDRNPELRADIIVSGIPDQGEPLGEALLRQCHPRLLIVVDADYPTARRSSSKLRSRLAQSGIPVIYTRTAGATTVGLSRHGWKAESIVGQTMDSLQAARIISADRSHGSGPNEDSVVVRENPDQAP